ncbi:alpha/beta fold hydrolase [Plantactinospora siamensis]|uniref:Alpha/beta fold hydrolase n=1 Tax=Plantactinospora siamensis TaxID=555372 RepID=A0ABV6P114_9ACTN
MSTFTGSDGAHLYYEDRNPESGPPIVALAGGPTLHPRYLGDLAGLGRDRRLIVPHPRGVGESPLPADTERASFWHQAEDLEHLRVALGLDRLLLLGHSAGTRLAISYAARYPERVAGLILVGPPAGYLVDVPSDAKDLLDRRRQTPELEAAVAAWGAGPETEDDPGFNAWQQRIAPIGYASWGERERAHAADGWYSFAAYWPFFSVDPPADLAARLDAVTAPVLVVSGAVDCSVGVAPALAVAELFPAGESTVIPDSGHFPWVEQPAAFRRAVDGFLDRLPLA